MLSLLLMYGLLLVHVSPARTYKVLVSSGFRIGNGQQDSIDPNTGNLLQPFYNKDGQWIPLTYSDYPMSFAISGITLGMPDVSYSSNASATVTQTANGSITFTRNYILSGRVVFINMTLCGNTSSVQTWIGTNDDWIGNTDRPEKTVGYLTGAGFFRKDNSYALKISSAAEAVLFFSFYPNAKAMIAACCAFTNIVGKVTTDQQRATSDGSYAIYIPFMATTAQTCETSIVMYAAGKNSDLASIYASLPTQTSITATTSTATTTSSTKTSSTTTSSTKTSSTTRTGTTTTSTTRTGTTRTSTTRTGTTTTGTTTTTTTRTSTATSSTSTATSSTTTSSTTTSSTTRTGTTTTSTATTKTKTISTTTSSTTTRTITATTTTTSTVTTKTISTTTSSTTTRTITATTTTTTTTQPAVGISGMMLMDVPCRENMANNYCKDPAVEAAWESALGSLTDVKRTYVSVELRSKCDRRLAAAASNQSTVSAQYWIAIPKDDIDPTAISDVRQSILSKLQSINTDQLEKILNSATSYQMSNLTMLEPQITDSSVLRMEGCSCRLCHESAWWLLGVLGFALVGSENNIACYS